MGRLSQQQLDKLTAVLKMPLAGDSHELVTLLCQYGYTLEARKALLEMVSPVLSEALQVHACYKLQVQGSVDWQQLLSLALCTEEHKLTPDDVQRLLPIAHLYDMKGAKNMIAASAQAFQFSTFYNSPMYVMTWLALAGTYQAPGLGMACAKFILAKLAEEMCKDKSDRDGFRRDMLLNFEPTSINSVQGPPEAMAFLAAVFKAQGAWAGL